MSLSYLVSIIVYSGLTFIFIYKLVSPYERLFTSFIKGIVKYCMGDS